MADCWSWFHRPIHWIRSPFPIVLVPERKHGSIFAVAQAAAWRRSGSRCSSEALGLHLHLGGLTAWRHSGSPAPSTSRWTGSSCYSSELQMGVWRRCCLYQRAKSLQLLLSLPTEGGVCSGCAGTPWSWWLSTTSEAPARPWRSPLLLR